MREYVRVVTVAGCAMAVASCTASPVPSSPSTATTPAAATPAASSTAPASFVNRVWQVAASTAVAPGQLYVFLSDGTLVIASPTGTPSLGVWRRDGADLTMVEDGRPYQVDILSLTDAEFRIRSHGPGEPVDIRLVPADDGVAAGAQAPR